MALLASEQNGDEGRSLPPMSFLGLGQMGHAFARAFLNKGYKITVWNRSAAKARSLVDAGAVLASSAAECIAASPVVISCFIGIEAFEAVFSALDTQDYRDRILVDYSSSSPSRNRRAASLAEKLQFRAYIRGAVISTPLHVGTPGRVAWYSGDEKAYRSVERHLAVMADPVFIDENPGTTALYETAFANMFYAVGAGFVQAMAVLKASGMYKPGGCERMMTEFLNPQLAHFFPSVLRDLAVQVDNGKYTTNDEGAKLGQSEHSVTRMIQLDQELGLTSVIMKPFLELIKLRISQGGAEDEMSSLVETVSNPATASKF